MELTGANEPPKLTTEQVRRRMLLKLVIAFFITTVSLTFGVAYLLHATQPSWYSIPMAVWCLFLIVGSTVGLVMFMGAFIEAVMHMRLPERF